METYNPIEKAQIKMDMLIRQRPSAFRSTVWHSIMRVIFFILGLISFFVSIVMLYNLYELYARYEQAASVMDELLPESEELREQLIRHIPPELWVGNVLCGFVCFFLALALFLLARYCRKIIKRNRYIIEMENVWEEMKKSATNNNPNYKTTTV